MSVAGKRSDEGNSATLATAVYSKLRQDLLTGDLAAGSKIRIDWVVTNYGIGASPVREALNRLATEGLLDRHDQRGFYAKPLSLAELEELTRTRCWLEEMGLRHSIANRSPAWEEELVLALHRLARLTDQVAERPRSLNEEWNRLHVAFHRALISACGSHWIIRYCSLLSDQCLRYRVAVPREIDSERNCANERKAIASAALDGDADKAVAALIEHFRASATASSAYLK